MIGHNRSRMPRCCLMLLLLIAGGSFSFAQDKKSRWLIRHSIPVDSLQKGTNAAGQFQKALGQRSIVFLSDGHQSGATRVPSASLIRFLHEEMDFDLLVLESSLPSADSAWNSTLSGKSDFTTAARRQIAGFISNCSTSAGLLQYIGEQAAAKHPLIVSGCGPWAKKDARFLLQQVDSVLLRNAPDQHQSADYRLFRDLVLPSDSGGRREKPDSSQKQFLWDYTGRLEALLLKAPGDSLWLQMLAANLGSAVKARLYIRPRENAELIEAAMAANLRWISQRKYPGLKTIVWASPYHLLNDANGRTADAETAAHRWLGKTYTKKVFYIPCQLPVPAAPAVSGQLRRSGIKTSIVLLDKKAGAPRWLRHSEGVLGKKKYQNGNYFNALLWVGEDVPCSWVD